MPWLRWAREQAYRSGAYKPATEVDAARLDEFVRLNEPQWPPVAPVQGGATVLVEGHLSQYGPNYLARTAVAARTLQARHGHDVIVVLPGYPHEWIVAERAYRSFGLLNFEYLRSQGSVWRLLWKRQSACAPRLALCSGCARHATSWPFVFLAFPPAI